MKKFCTKCGIILMIIALVFTFIMRYSFMAAFKEPVDVLDEGLETKEELKRGLSIESEVYLLLECFGSKETSHKNRAGQTTSTSTDYYYILPVFVGEEDTYYVALEVDGESDNLYTYEKIANETMNWLYGLGDTAGSYSVDFTGYLDKLDKEGYEYMKDWFEETQFFESDADIEKYVLPYVAKPYRVDIVKKMVFVFVGMFVLGLVLLIAGLAIDGKYGSRRKALKQSDRTININGNVLSVSMLDDIDILVWKGKADKAAKRLTKYYGANPQQAEQIISGWNQMVGI